MTKMHHHHLVTLFFLFLCLLVPASFTAQTQRASFWDIQRKGANYFNKQHTREWFVSAMKTGIQFVRLVPNKWKSRQRDYLLGNADHFSTLDEADFQQLDQTLSQADSMGVKIVLSTLSLPGARWRQQNSQQFDKRLWLDSQYIPQAKEFWRRLAALVKNHSSIVGYDILNEPIPELATQYAGADREPVSSWYARVKGTPADLNSFNEQVSEAIREVDWETPIIIECGQWASPAAIEYLRPLDDGKVLYSIHVYDPFKYTNWKENGGKRRYPEKNALGNLDSNLLEGILRPVSLWQERHHIPSNRILVGEFGCNRMAPGAENYLSDLIQIFNRNKWHWAFYSYREDEWDGMDYELGTKPLGWKYWEEIEKGQTPELKRMPNSLWEVIHRELRK